jgi:hypothetical protein
MKSYQRICLREYTDETHKYQSDEQIQERDRLFNTLEAIEDEEQLLAFNWASIGYYLSDAYVKLFDHCGWMTELDDFTENMSSQVRMGRTELRRMDKRVVTADSWLASDESMKYQAFPHVLARFFFDPLDKHGTDIIAVNAAAFMKQYFSGIPLSNIQWFELTVWNIDSKEVPDLC